MLRHQMGDDVNRSQLLALSAVSAPSAFSNCVFNLENALEVSRGVAESRRSLCFVGLSSWHSDHPLGDGPRPCNSLPPPRLRVSA